jgi:PDDEXK-like domain of unknown function (DUF3799)
MPVAPDIQDGVYFQLDAETYHAIPALSSSGIKNLLISGPDFWYRTPWLNPDYADEDSEAKMIGRAYHKRILEGRQEFYSAYAETFSAPSYALKTIDDMTEALAKVAITLPSKAKKADYLAAVRTNCPDELIFDDLREQHDARHEGKEFLSHDLIAKIETAAKMIEAHPEISKCFSGGYPEVTVLWTEDDIRFKARFDYLKPKAIIDLKTFGNFMNKPIDNAIYSSMASGKYHIQAAFYMRAFLKAAEAASGKSHISHPPVPETSFGNFIDDLSKSDGEPPGFYFVFQQKGIAPLARAKKFKRGSLWSCGEVAIEEAIKRFRDNMKQFGELPWVDATPIQDFDDDQFPAYTTEL